MFQLDCSCSKFTSRIEGQAAGPDEVDSCHVSVVPLARAAPQLPRCFPSCPGTKAGEDEDGFINLLLQAPVVDLRAVKGLSCAILGASLRKWPAHELGAWRLKKWAIRMAVHHFKELALRRGRGRGALEVLPSALLTEVLREVAVGYDRLLPSAAKNVRWELSLLPKAEKCLENTYEALTSPDLACGAGGISGGALAVRSEAPKMMWSAEK
eukprot:Skav222706  [mRNA]  locus=scaffold402:618036:621929:+ [translate_table: standard]